MINADDSQQIKGLSPDKTSPGKLLLQARLQAGLSQEQVAKELYMTVYKVKALENDDYSRLSPGTFARGYIRAYANLVKVDVVVILAAYDALMDRLTPTEPVQGKADVVVESSHRGAWQFLAVIGIFFIALWLISVWFFDNRNDDQYPVRVDTSSSASSLNNASSSVMAAVSKSDALVVASATGVNSSNSANSSIASGAASTGSAIMGAANSVATTKPAAVVSESVSSAKKTGLDELSFSFREESWLEVSDSRGDVLATELQPAKTKLKVVGLAPFDVKLGNAPVVDIYFNNKKIDVVPSRGTNVLTLKVGN
jgi:cytoskeleton protein RodZ